ncbi:MAG: hypothetical protein AAF914_15075 [Pseudomonadota bacterium]
MKRPRTTTPRRARTMSGAVARSRKEAAIQMVRLEFEASRLEMAVDQSLDRARAHAIDLDAVRARRRRLIAALGE